MNFEEGYRHIDREPNSETIFQALKQLNKDVLEAYIQRYLTDNDKQFINVIFYTAPMEDIQRYGLFFRKRLVGYIYYGYVPLFCNLHHRGPMNTDISKSMFDIPFFKIEFIAPYRLN